MIPNDLIAEQTAVDGGDSVQNNTTTEQTDTDKEKTDENGKWCYIRRC